MTGRRWGLALLVVLALPRPAPSSRSISCCMVLPHRSLASPLPMTSESLLGGSKVRKRPAADLRTTVRRQRLLRLELKRLGKLPAASKYARHRIAIVQKALSLLGQTERDADETEELLRALKDLGI